MTEALWCVTNLLNQAKEREMCVCSNRGKSGLHTCRAYMYVLTALFLRIIRHPRIRQGDGYGKVNSWEHRQ